MELRDFKQQHKGQFDQLFSDNERLSRTCQEQDNTIKNLHGDLHKLSKKLEDSNFDLNNTKSALRARDENLSHVQKQLDDANKSLARLQVNTRLKI